MTNNKLYSWPSDRIGGLEVEGNSSGGGGGGRKLKAVKIVGGGE